MSKARPGAMPVTPAAIERLKRAYESGETTTRDLARRFGQSPSWVQCQLKMAMAAASSNDPQASA